MTKPQKAVNQAISDFDRAVDNPAQRGDAMSDLFAGLGAAFAEIDAQKRARKAEHRARVLTRMNSPEALAKRSAASRRGWANRKARQAAEETADLDQYTPYREGPRCDEMNHNSVGSEIFCQLDPGHDGDHDDEYGTSWERGD